MKITGACHCGHIRFEAEVDPGTSSICHCTDCQVLSGTAYRTAVFTLKGTFCMLGAAPKIYVKTADNGNRRQQSFCPECGTPIYSTATGDDPKVLAIRLGTINERSALAPQSQIWCRSRLAWVDDLTAIPGTDTQAGFGASGERTAF